MKQQISTEQWNELSQKGKVVIQLWKKRKNYPENPGVTIGEAIELLIAYTYNLHTDFSDSRFFNNILINIESLIAWDGEELVDILWHEVKLAIQKRISIARMFPEDYDTIMERQVNT